MREHATIIQKQADENDMNQVAQIERIYPDGRIHITNTNMPFCGNLNIVVTPEEFEADWELAVPEPTQAEQDGDEWFVNNLIGLASGALALSKKKGTRVDRHMLARWAFDHTNRG